MTGINPAWIKDMKKEIKDAKSLTDPIPFEPKVITYHMAAKWLIAAIANRGLIPSVKNLGGGVKRIGIKGTCCPLCGREL